MSQDDLGKKISEKKSVIAKLENGAIKPSNKLISKLEHTLDIKLKVNAESVTGQVDTSTKKSSKGFTLGDLIKIKKK